MMIRSTQHQIMDFGLWNIECSFIPTSIIYNLTSVTEGSV
jgi:hypothetical protein